MSIVHTGIIYWGSTVKLLKLPSVNVISGLGNKYRAGFYFILNIIICSLTS
jgi:hypothetical protein